MIIPNVDFALFLVRLLVGITFILHGSQKVFGLFDGPGMEGWLSYLGSIGVKNRFIGVLAAFFELFGGIMVSVGLAPQIGAAMLLITMIAAIYLVHYNAYFLPKGMEYALNLAILCVVIILSGGDSYVLWNPLMNSI